MESPKISISVKLLAGFIGLALVVLSVVLLAVSQILDNRIRDDINTNFQEAGQIFEQMQDVRFRQLRQTATLVAELPYMKAAISTADKNTVNQQIRGELARLLQFDSSTNTDASLSTRMDSVGLIMVFDKEGMPLGQLSEEALSEGTTNSKPGVNEALAGFVPQQSYIWKRGNSYFNVITIPVFLGRRVVAALSLGYPIRNREAEILANVIDYKVSYFVDNSLLTTFDAGFSEEDNNTLSKEIESAGLKDLSSTAGQTLTIKMQNQRWLMYLSPMVQQPTNAPGISGYYVVVKSLTEALQPLYRLQKVIFLIGLGGILLAILLGVTLTNNFTKPIERLLEGIKRIENDNYDQPVPVVSSDELGKLTDTFNKLSAYIKESLEEKEALLGEIHHRVKNNLAIISGLLKLETFQHENTQVEGILKNSQLRIQSMSIVHEMLYEAQNFSKLSFGNFASQMIAAIEDEYVNRPSGIEVRVDTNDFDLNVNQAVPCGLIINELVTNAFKHAYPNGESGIIEVNITGEEEDVFMEIKDQGKGLPEGFSIESAETPGFMLVKILSDQIDADLLIDTEGGTIVTLGFTKQDKKGAMSSMP